MYCNLSKSVIKNKSSGLQTWKAYYLAMLRLNAMIYTYIDPKLWFQHVNISSYEVWCQHVNISSYEVWFQHVNISSYKVWFQHVNISSYEVWFQHVKANYSY